MSARATLDQTHTFNETRTLELQLSQRLIRVGIALSAERNLDRFFQLIVGEARALTSADAASLYLRQGDHLKFKIVQNNAQRQSSKESQLAELPDIPLPNRISDCKTIVSYVALTGKTLNIENVYNLPHRALYRFDPSYDQLTGYVTTSLLTVPLRRPSGDDGGITVD